MNLKYVPHNQSKCFKATTNFFCTIIACICVLSWFPVNACIRTLLRAELHTLDETIILISGDKVPHFEENSVFVNSAKISPHGNSTVCFYPPFRQYVPKNYLTPELYYQPRILSGLSLLHFVVVKA